MPAEKTALLPVSADEAFALLTDPDRLRRWKTVSARVDLRAGGGYRWTVLPGHVAVGTYREVIPGRRIVFGWGWEGSSDLGPDASTVTITLEPADGGTLVRLIHAGLTAEQEAENLVGWNHFFERLVVAATTGDAGPDPWAVAPQVFDPLLVAETCLAQCQRLVRDLEPAALAGDGADHSAGQVVDELTVAIERVGLAADVAASASPPSPPASSLSATSIESRLASAGADAVESWLRRGLSGDVSIDGVEVPARLVAALLSIDLVVASADIGAATGRAFAPAPEVVSYVRSLAAEIEAAAPDVRVAVMAIGMHPTDTDVLARLHVLSDRITA